MTETNNKELEGEVVTADTDTRQDQQQETVSDTRLLVAPLYKYGAIAIVIVSAIVTATIMLNGELDTVEDEIATIQNEIAVQNLAEMEVITPVVEDTSGTQTTADLVSPALTPVAISAEAEMAFIDETDTTVTEATVTETAAPVTPDSETIAPVLTAEFAPQEFAPPAFDHKARIAEQHAYIAKQDQEYLDSFKNRQAKQIEWLRDQLARQQQRIEAIEKRNQETYEMRAASIKRMQQAREESLGRI